MCITEVMDHIIEEGNRIFKGSTHADDWCIYHDRLSSWWSVEAQLYLHEKGFGHRQWKAAGDTNNHISKYYQGSLMGDSPELMPLDSSLFNELINGVHTHVLTTRLLPIGAAGKFEMSTPKKAWKTMVEVWDYENSTGAVPSSSILRDIDRFATAVCKIIKKQGTIVTELDNRNGHRKVASRMFIGGRLCQKAKAALREQLKFLKVKHEKESGGPAALPAASSS